jgi:hypothetical protein
MSHNSRIVKRADYLLDSNGSYKIFPTFSKRAGLAVFATNVLEIQLASRVATTNGRMGKYAFESRYQQQHRIL